MTTPDAHASDRLLRDGLERLRRRWFVAVWSRVVAWWALATLAMVGAGAVTLALTGARGGALVAGVAAVAALSITALGVLAWPWRHRPPDRHVARYAEERVPELEERLVSAAGLLGGADGDRTPLQRLVVAEGARTLASLDLDRVLPSRVIARGVGLALVGLAILSLALFSWRATLERAWQAARVLWFPGTITLVVEPGDAEVAEGSEVALRVRIDGIDPAAWDAPVEVRSASPHLREHGPLSRDGDGWSGLVPAGDAPFFYRVASGGLVSPEFHVEVRRRPRVERIALHYEFPAFSGLAPRTEEDGGDVFAPAGTRVTVRVHTRDPIGDGALALSSGAPIPLTRREDRLLEGQLVVTREDAYRVSLRDPHGIEADGDTEYFVRPMDDRPPDVRVLRPGGDSRVTRLEEVRVEARADDDHGVARFELVYAPRGGAERVVSLGSGGTSVTGQHTIFVEDLDVRPGDFLTYYVRARDVGRGKRPTETRSDIFFLEVRPFNEEFEAAQSQQGAQGGEGSFDDLARQQKDIIVATWRLDRRSGAGRSAQDIRVVARSQADLKARAEQLAQQMAPRAVPMPPVQLPPFPPGPRPGPQPAPPPRASSSPPPQENPMRRAVEAMGRAQQALEALDTPKALPHENEALNEILRAQAEVRRRQVARQQQQSRGGRGGQSGNQDLSALFDRELQRQQQTNYEQRASAQQQATSETRREDEQLRRLRELAARQDELGRQQQELARRRAQMSAEEVKRRLERLTREQEQLRQQAEALAQRMQPRPGSQQDAQQDGQSQSGEPQQGASARQSSSDGQTAQSSGQASGDVSSAGADAQRVRDAAREMARAAGELQRQSPEAASAQAARALDRLRAAERGLAGAFPDERRRRAGDLQAEARQIAGAGRRVAAEAAAGATAESLRRLAGQQARLAERAGALERNAREMAARESSGASGDAVRRAARDLAGAQVSERLRQGAEAARQGADGQRDVTQAARELAASARAAAQPLDRLADRLADASGQDAEARRLSDALAQTRGMRERLADLERRAALAQRGTGTGRAGEQSGGPDATASRGGDAQPSRATSQGSTRASSSEQRGTGQQGGQAQGASGGSGEGDGGELAELRQDLLREMRQRQDVMDTLRRDDPGAARAMSALEGWAPGRSAPGTEAWKQDFARWEALKRQVSLALERHETELAQRLSAREARDRLAAGADDRPDEGWTREVADYFKAIAAARPPRR